MNRIQLIALFVLGGLALPACERRPEASPELAEALAYAAEYARRASASPLLNPKPEPRPIDQIDPTRLVTEADVLAALEQAGVASDPAGFEVQIGTEHDDFARYGGRGRTGCRVRWGSKVAGSTAAGSFLVEVVELPHFELMKRAGSQPLSGLGDEAFVIEDRPYVRVGDTVLTIDSTTSTGALSVELLRRASARLRRG